MSTIFFGGSRQLSRLNPMLRDRLHNLMRHDHTALIGDANGIDKAIQSFFHAENYPHVVLYSMENRLRNNLGNWPVKVIFSERKTRDFLYFALKDAQMSLDADYGFMIWDARSKGTLNNVFNLVQQSKPVLLYNSPARVFLTIKSMDDIFSVVGNCSPEIVEYFNKKIKLDRLVASRDQRVMGF